MEACDSEHVERVCRKGYHDLVLRRSPEKHDDNRGKHSSERRPRRRKGDRRRSPDKRASAGRGSRRKRKLWDSPTSSHNVRLRSISAVTWHLLVLDIESLSHLPCLHSCTDPEKKGLAKAAIPSVLPRSHLSDTNSALLLARGLYSLAHLPFGDVSALTAHPATLAAWTLPCWLMQVDGMLVQDAKNRPKRERERDRAFTSSGRESGEL